MPSSKRTKSLNMFLSEYRLGTKPTGKTYVSPSGADTSTIDYILYSLCLTKTVLRMETLTDQQTYVSDHYPVCCTLEWTVDRNMAAKEDRSVAPSRRVKWDNINKEEYNRTVTRGITEQRQDISSEGVLDAQICKLNQIMVQAAEVLGPQRVRRQRKAKLDSWTPEISKAVKDKKAFYDWKRAE